MAGDREDDEEEKAPPRSSPDSSRGPAAAAAACVQRDTAYPGIISWIEALVLLYIHDGRTRTPETLDTRVRQMQSVDS